jgi:penicillin-binding protein A
LIGRIQHLSLALSLAFLVVAGALGYWQIVRAQDVTERPTNPRIIEEERRIPRGRILDRNGEVLASSRPVGEIMERVYAYPPLAHIVGYASIRHGKTGVEDAYDAYLRGQRGAGAMTELRRALLRPHEPGDDIVLTIDLRLQRLADELLGDNAGAIAMVNAHTGEVLALASHPYFDANSLDDDWEKLANDPSRPFVGRAISGQYVPGSIFKVVTGSAALDLGLQRPEERHHHEADLVVQGFRIRNTNHPQLTDLSFAEEFAWSCNVAFAMTGLALGFPEHIDYNFLAPAGEVVWNRDNVGASTERLRDYARRFGIGQRVPFDLPTAAGRFAETDELTAVDLANTAFGQGDLQVSPLQMALVAATVPNGGELPTPYVVAEARDETGSVRIHQPGTSQRRVIRQQTAADMNAMMVLSVDTAYAQPARIPGVHVGGKTGTAEVGGGRTPHSWFIGYAPAERPGVAVAVILENKGSGTTFATPMGGKLMQEALRLGY